MKSRTLPLFTALLLTFTGLTLQSQDHYNISINIEGLPDTIVFLGSYYGENMTVDDTALISTPGEIHFSGNRKLNGGVYFLVNQEKLKLFEFVIDQSQDFELTTDTINYVNHMQVTGSEENEIFFEYQQMSAKLYEDVQAFQQMKGKINSQDSMNRVDQEIRSINRQNVEYKVSFIQQHPGHILSVIFKASREPDIPDSLKGKSKEQRMLAYQYYKTHYWDNTDLSDPRILKTPLFHDKLNKYFTQVISKNPDSVIVEIDKVLSACEGNDPLFEYLAWYFTATYESASIMGYDKIFVHMVDTYFRERNHGWVSASMYDNLIKRADKIKPLLIGNYAPELILMDTNNRFLSLYELQHEYVVIFFWTTTCSECKKEVTHLEKLYNNDELDLEIYSVNTDTSFSKWKDYLKDKSLNWVNVNGTRSISKDYHILYDIFKTPTIFVIDKKKRIIAKHLSANQIFGFVERHKKLEEKQN